MRLLRDLILVKPALEEEQLSGIVLVRDDKVKPQEGTVIGCGADVTQVQVGDHILYEQFAGSPYEDNFIMSQSDVIAVIDNSTDV